MPMQFMGIAALRRQRLKISFTMAGNTAFTMSAPGF
jgi:hypothetical protein